jgi:hypothetical protein
MARGVVTCGATVYSLMSPVARRVKEIGQEKAAPVEIAGGRKADSVAAMRAEPLTGLARTPRAANPASPLNW